MGKKHSAHSLNSELNNPTDAESINRQSEDPKLDATASGSDATSDVNQLNAFGGDQPARVDAYPESQIESHGENLASRDERSNESVEAVADEDASDADESKYNS
jgi:hypothetical protein